MNDETAVELLKIATTLTEAVLSSKKATTAHPTPLTHVDIVFKDCLKAVEDHFSALTGGTK